MRRLVLSALVLFVCAATAGAVVQGYPDSVFITGVSGQVTIDGTTTLASADFQGGGSYFNAGSVLPGFQLTEADGAADDVGNQIAFQSLGDSVTIDFRFSTYAGTSPYAPLTTSPQAGYMQNSGEPNLSLYLGHSGTAVDAGDSVRLNFAWYDTTQGALAWNYGSQNSLGISYTGGGPALPSTNYIYSLSATSAGPVYGIRMVFAANNAGATFYLDAMQNPEPGTIALFALGLGGLGFAVARRRRKKNA